LELNQTDSSQVQAWRFPYEVTFVSGSDLREVLIRAKLPDVLNDLRRLIEYWKVPVTLGPAANSTLEQLLVDEPHNESQWISDVQKFSSPAQAGQFRIASILFAVSCLAIVVVIFLVTGQRENHGKISPLGLVLAAILLLVPSVVALHVCLGKIVISCNEGFLHVERRRGLWGTTVTTIQGQDIQGSWLLPNDTRDCVELLLLRKSSFCSFPIARSAISPQLAAIGHIEPSPPLQV